MSGRDIVELAVTRHYRRSVDPNGSAARLLAGYDADRRAEALAGGGQSYDGELAMLRGLVRTLRVVVRDGGSAEKQRAEVRRLLWQHVHDEAEAREKSSPKRADATPECFQAGRTYTRDVQGKTAEFRVDHIATHPDGSLWAFGWYRRHPHKSWHPYSQDDVQFDDWSAVSDEGADE